jgi:hypothetical protein
MKSSKPVIVLHFSPLEMYPPVMNLLRYVSEEGSKRQWKVITTDLPVKDSGRFSAPGISILRRGISGKDISRIKRLFSYLKFNLSAVLIILQCRPGSILYFETLSCLPAFFCRSLFKKKTKLLIHYHEYVSSEEIKAGSSFFRYLSRKESFLLPQASWISHTNKRRLEMFRRDIQFSESSIFRVLPNFPPRGWKVSQLNGNIPMPVRIVYTGALSLDTLYMREFASWVIGKNGSVVWDIYSQNPEKEAMNYISSLRSGFISFKGAVSYENLPSVLRQYDVGVILYKGHIPNFVENAPNKLFEYHVNGLDVWFPLVMTGSMPYQTKGSFPKILALDFDRLDLADLSELTDRKGLKQQIGSYCCEDVIPELLNEIDND